MTYLLFSITQDEYESGPVQSDDPVFCSFQHLENKKAQEALRAWEDLRDAVYERLHIPEMAQTIERFSKWMRSKND